MKNLIFCIYHEQEENFIISQSIGYYQLAFLAVVVGGHLSITITKLLATATSLEIKVAVMWGHVPSISWYKHEEISTIVKIIG